MDDSSASSPRFPAPRRVATAPISLPEPTPPIPALSEAIVETLYSHPNVKIISFTASGRALWRNSGLRGDDAPGTLSWSSQLERTIAVGPFRIYRAPGSVAFLNCGSALQPILLRSQCWCIDEINSKFVLQIRRPNYWRIELPVAEPEDRERAEALKGVFDKILRFEKTQCPFKRAFTIDLPEEPSTPTKKKPWTPVLRSVSPTIDVDDSTTHTVEAQHTPIISRPTTPTPLRTKDKLDVPETFLAGHSGVSAQHTPPSVRIETAKLEAKIEAEIVEKLESCSNNSVLSSDADQSQVEQKFEQVTHSEDDSKLGRLGNKDEEFQFHQVLDSGKSSNVETRRHSDFGLSRVLDDTLDTRHSIPKSLVSAKTTSSLSLGETRADHSSTTLFDHQELRMTAKTPELQDEGSSSEDCLLASPITASPPLDGSLEDDPSVYEMHEGTGFKKGQMKTRLRRTARFAVPRSATLPPHLKLSMDRASDSSRIRDLTQESDIPPPLTLKEQDQMRVDISKESKEHEPGRRSSNDSFHSVESWHSDAPSRLPSPPRTCGVKQLEISMSTTMKSDDGLSDNDKVPELGPKWSTESEEESKTSRRENATTVPCGSPIKMVGAYPTGSSSEGVEKKSAPVLRRRAMTNHRPTTSITVGRALSPLPPAANLFTPMPAVERRPFHSKFRSFKNLPMAIIMKTCEVILGPPSHLIALMLKVAAKIIAGEWRGLVFGYSEEGEQIPVQWDYSEGEFSDWSDDEPYMGSHHNQNNDTPIMVDGDTTMESLDDSRTWGVD